MGWNDFLNSNSLGSRVFRKVAGGAVNAIEKGGNSVLDAADRKIDRMDKSAQKLGSGIDGLYDTTKNAVQNKFVDRNFIEETHTNAKKVKEGSQELYKEIPKPRI